MKKNLNEKNLERYSRQIILKDVGIIGQKKLLNSNQKKGWGEWAWPSLIMEMKNQIWLLRN